MSDCKHKAAQVLEKRENLPVSVDRMIRICRDQLMLPIRQTMEHTLTAAKYALWKAEGIMYIYTKIVEIRIYQKLTDLVDLLPIIFISVTKAISKI